MITAEQAARDYNNWLGQRHAQMEAADEKIQRRFTQLEADVDQFRISYYHGLPASAIPEVSEIVAVIRSNRALKAATTRKKNRARREKAQKRAEAEAAKAARAEARAAAKALKEAKKAAQAEAAARQGTLPF